MKLQKKTCKTNSVWQYICTMNKIILFNLKKRACNFYTIYSNYYIIINCYHTEQQTSKLSASNISTRWQAMVSHRRATDRWWVFKNLSINKVKRAPVWLRWMASTHFIVFLISDGCHKTSISSEKSYLKKTIKLL